MRDVVRNEVVRLDEKIWKKYNPDYAEGSYTIRQDIANMAFEADIETILTKADDIEDTYEEIMDIISASVYSKEILAYVNIDKAKDAAYIRSDFGAALKDVKEGTDLSWKLGWGFSNRDLIELTKLHKSNKYRKKIEDLLEDCNFHYECGLLSDRRYDELLSELQKEE